MKGENGPGTGSRKLVGRGSLIWEARQCLNWIGFLAHHLRTVGSRRSKACFVGQGLGRSFVTSLWLGTSVVFPTTD